MRTLTLFFTAVVSAMGLTIQAQSANPAAKAEPAPKSNIQVTVHQGAQSGQEMQEVYLSPESAQLVLGHWQMTTMTNSEGAVTKEQKPEERDRFNFMQDNTLSVVKHGYTAEGFWKFSPETGLLIITDQSRSQQVQYTVMRVSKDELVMHYSDPVKGGSMLHFVPVP